MRIRTETGHVTAGVYGPHQVELCVEDHNLIEVGLKLTTAEAYMLAGVLIACAEESACQERHAAVTEGLDASVAAQSDLLSRLAEKKT